MKYVTYNAFVCKTNVYVGWLKKIYELLKKKKRKLFSGTEQLIIKPTGNEMCILNNYLIFPKQETFNINF